MPIQVTCSSCGGVFNAPDTAGGKQAKCPKCGAAIQIPSPAPPQEVYEAEVEPGLPPEVEPPADLPTTDDRKPCPMCGEMIQRSAVKCRFCGEIFDETLAKAERRKGPQARPGESVEEAAKRLAAEKHDKTTAIEIFLTSLFGCFAPIIAIYGIVFLMRRPYAFKYKGLAIAGTIIHCCWTLLLIVSLVLGQLLP